MTVLYPAIEPYDHGMLDVGDGNLVYWEVCGNPHGKPAVVLHGGPGSGCSTGVWRYFDPHAYCSVLFDQRGCGRSTPHASDLRTDLSVNTTAHLLADMELLRQYLGIDKWLLFGGSWGSTLGLAYAERYPHRVTEIVLGGVTTTRRTEIDWLYRGVAPLFPTQWARFRAGGPRRNARAILSRPTTACCTIPIQLCTYRRPGSGARGRPPWHQWTPRPHRSPGACNPPGSSRLHAL